MKLVLTLEPDGRLSLSCNCGRRFPEKKAPRVAPRNASAVNRGNRTDDADASPIDSSRRDFHRRINVSHVFRVMLAFLTGLRGEKYSSLNLVAISWRKRRKSLSNVPGEI